MFAGLTPQSGIETSFTFLRGFLSHIDPDLRQYLEGRRTANKSSSGIRVSSDGIGPYKSRNPSEGIREVITAYAALLKSYQWSVNWPLAAKL